MRSRLHFVEHKGRSIRPNLRPRLGLDRTKEGLRALLQRVRIVPEERLST
jgi:hypothetical protein